MEAAAGRAEEAGGVAAGSRAAAAARAEAERREAGDVMKMKHFVKRLDHPRIVNAIKEAEQKISAPVRVFVSHRAVSDPIKAARRALAQLGIDKDPDHKGVVVFIAPVSQQFAVFGDKCIHEQRGDEFWARVVGVLTEHFEAGDFTIGIVSAIARLGEEPDKPHAT